MLSFVRRRSTALLLGLALALLSPAGAGARTAGPPAALAACALRVERPAPLQPPGPRAARAAPRAAPALPSAAVLAPRALVAALAPRTTPPPPRWLVHRALLR